MSISLPYRFMLSAILFVTVGMILGLYMGPSQDFRLVPVHAHLNLLGWATMMLAGLYYRGDAVAAASRLAHWHFWLAFVGLILFAHRPRRPPARQPEPRDRAHHRLVHEPDRDADLRLGRLAGREAREIGASSPSI